VTPETLFNAGGITKLVTAVTALKLAEEGKLDLTLDINKLLVAWKLPSNQFTIGHAVTVRELLSHNAGIDQHFPTAYAPADKVPTLLQMLNGEKPAKSLPIAVTHLPGTEFEYSSAAFSIVQQVLADVVHEPFQEIVQQEVFTPLRMNNSTFTQPKGDAPDPSRATGHAYGESGQLEARAVAFPELASSGLWTTPTDLARLLVALQKSNSGSGLLSPRTYSRLLTPVIGNVGLGVFLAGSGASLRIRVRGSDGMPSDGYAAWLVGYAKEGKGAIVMSNGNGLLVGFSLLRAIAQQYGWREYIPTRTIYNVDPRVFTRYIGKYDLAGDVVNISTDGQTLYGQINDSPKLALLPSSATNYFLNRDLFHEVTVHFVSHSNKLVEEIDFQYPYRSYKALRIH
jgi:CubicO group peptidase (beta-lactamase class C family)